jgi:hypothetical protein
VSKKHILLAVLGLAALLVIVLIAFMSRPQRGRLRVFLKTDSQGNASLVGIPLRNGQLRDGALKTLQFLGCDVKLWNGGVLITNSTQISNLVDTLTAIERYSPARTNINTAPSPYE